jgi:hypothetical protein
LALPIIQKSTLRWYELDTCPFLYVRKKGKEGAPDEKGTTVLQGAQVPLAIKTVFKFA